MVKPTLSLPAISFHGQEMTSSGRNEQNPREKRVCFQFTVCRPYSWTQSLIVVIIHTSRRGLKLANKHVHGILLPIHSKATMTCSLQGIAMHRKPVHGRHSRIEVEMGVEKGLRNRQKGGLPRRTSCPDGSVLHSRLFAVDRRASLFL